MVSYNADKINGSYRIERGLFSTNYRFIEIDGNGSDDKIWRQYELALLMNDRGRE